MTPQAIIAQIVGWITQAVSIALLLLIACAVAGKFGLRVPWVPQIGEQPLAWLCGAWLAYRWKA